MDIWLTLSYWVDSAAGAAHFFLALFCLVLGPYVLSAPKGDARHRVLGSVWLICMITVNTSALTMYEISGRPNIFHAFALLSLSALIPGFISIRRYGLTRKHKHLVEHQIYMHWAYFGLASAGAWQFLTRLMHTFAGSFDFWPVIGTFIVLTVFASIAMNRWINSRLLPEPVKATA